MKEFLLVLIPSAFSVLITWMISRKKNNAETAEIGIRTVSGAVKIWQGLAEEFKKEVEELKELVNEYRQENENLRDEIRQLQQKFNLK